MRKVAPAAHSTNNNCYHYCSHKKFFSPTPVQATAAPALYSGCRGRLQITQIGNALKIPKRHNGLQRVRDVYLQLDEPRSRTAKHCAEQGRCDSTGVQCACKVEERMHRSRGEGAAQEASQRSQRCLCGKAGRHSTSLAQRAPLWRDSLLLRRPANETAGPEKKELGFFSLFAPRQPRLAHF